MKINDLRRDSGIGRLLWLYVWGPINLVVAFLPLMSLNLLQFPSLLILPFSKPLFRRYNRAMAFGVWGWWAYGVRELIGLKVLKYGDELPRRENVMLIANHQSMSDILVILCVAFDNGSIRRTTWMAKDVLKWVPGLGWGMAFLDTIYLKRTWADDEASIRKTFARIIDENVTIWLSAFPEGTRIRPPKLAEAKKFAASRNMPEPEHVLIPRPKGFVASIKGLRTHIDAVYSCTLGYEERIPSLLETIRGDIDRTHIHTRRIPIADLPSEDDELAAWLRDEFQLKDSLLKEFHRSGKFPNPLNS